MKFKDYYDKECALLIADKLIEYKPNFNKEQFV